MLEALVCLTGRPKAGPTPSAGAEPGATAETAGGLLCDRCGFHVTDRRYRIEVQGQHEHRFMNPGGFLYHVGCFAEAVGCANVGPDSPEYPWFVGYLWCCSICGGCGQQLGWRFRGGAAPGLSTFFGLILDRLRDAPGGDPSGPPSA
jgi:hypothetical protein